MESLEFAPCLLKGSNEAPFHGKVFCIQNGQRRWVPSKNWIEMQGLEWPTAVQWTTADDLNVYPEGSPIDYRPIDYRRSKLLGGVDVANMVGLEIGPLASPVILKSEGTVYYLDHASSEDLVVKYEKDPSVDVSRICAVDFIWSDQPLRQTIPLHVSFDYVIASHLIEHVPDVIGWLREVSDILKPEGILALAIPDRRYTLDYLRQLTSIADLVEGYLHGYRRPTPRQVFDFCYNAIKVDPSQAWKPGFDPSACERSYSDASAMMLAVKSMKEGRYVDVHCSVFTCDSLLDLLKGLFPYGLIDFRIARFFPPEPGSNEFFVILQKLRSIEDPGARLRVQLESLPEHIR